MYYCTARDHVSSNCILYIFTSMCIAAMNEPTFRSVWSRCGDWLRMDSCVELWMGPFIFFLCDWIVSNTTWVWCKTDKVSCFVVSDVAFHFFNLSSTDCTMFCPVSMTFAFGMFFPVFRFSAVSTYADPAVIVGCHRPMSHCMPCNECAYTWIWICEKLLALCDGMLGCLANHPVSDAILCLQPFV